MKTGVLIRQLPGSPPVITAVITMENVADHKRFCRINDDDDFDVEHYMTSRLEGEKESFIKQFIEFKNAEWFIQFIHAL